MSERKEKWDLNHQFLNLIEEISKLFADGNVKIENALKQGNKEKFVEAVRDAGLEWNESALDLLFKTLLEAYEMSKSELAWAPS